MRVGTEVSGHGTPSIECVALEPDLALSNQDRELLAIWVSTVL